MRKKPFWIPLITAFATIGIVYVIGNLLDISFLKFTISQDAIEFQLLPIAIGVAVAFGMEYWLRHKNRYN